MYKRLLAFSLLMLATVAAGSASAAKPTTIKVGYLPYSSSLPFFVAKERGYFSQQGLQIKSVKCASANEAISALKAGQVDFIVGVGLSTFFAVESASPGSFKCFQPCIEDLKHPISYILLPHGSKIKKLSELRGKKVGTYSGTSQVLVLRLLLERIGLDPNNPKDVIIGDVDTRLQVDALAAGQFDAFLMIEPYATRAIVIRGAQTLVKAPRVKYILNPFPAGANAVSTAYLHDHPDIVKKVLKAMNSSIVYVGSHESQAKAILPKYDQTLTPSVAARSNLYKWLTTSQTDLKSIQKYADLLAQGHVLDKPVKVSPMFMR